MKKNVKDTIYAVTKGTAQLGVELYTAKLIMPLLEQVADAVIPGSGTAVKVAKTAGNIMVGAAITWTAGKYTGELFDDCKAIGDSIKTLRQLKKEAKETQTANA